MQYPHPRIKGFYTLIFAASLLHLVTPFIYNPLEHQWSDPGRWWQYAVKGIEHAPMAYIDPVMYPVWLSYVIKLTGDNPVYFALYSGLLSMLTPWIWYRFFREVSDNRQAALIFWLILSLLPSWIGIYSYTMSETLLLPLLGMSLWFSFRCLRKPTLNAFLLALLLWFLTAMTRGITAPLGFILLVYVWLQYPKKGLPLLYASLLAILFTATLCLRTMTHTQMCLPLGNPYLNQIYAQSGNKKIELFFTRNGEINYYYIFQSPSLETQPLQPFSDWESSRSGTAKIEIDILHQPQDWKNQLNLHKQGIMEQARLIKENLVLLFFSRSWPDENPQHIFENLNNQMRYLWLPLTLFALISNLANAFRHHCRISLLLSVLLCSWIFFQGLWLISVNEGRYRKPAEGLIIAMSVFAFTRKSKRRNMFS